MKTSDEADTGGGAVTTTGGRRVSSARGGAGAGDGGVSWLEARSTRATSISAMTTSSTDPASTRARNATSRRVNIGGKGNTTRARAHPVHFPAWTRNEQSASLSHSRLV